MESNTKEFYSKIKKWFRIIYAIAALTLWLLIIKDTSKDHYPQTLEDFTNDQYFSGLLVEKHKNKPNGSFFFINLQNSKGEVVEVHISEIKFLDGLEEFYDYIQVGDTLLKEKGSRKIILKSGVRSKVFEAKERKPEE